jgi:hypothetical protein
MLFFNALMPALLRVAPFFPTRPAPGPFRPKRSAAFPDTRNYSSFFFHVLLAYAFATVYDHLRLTRAR